MNSLIQVLSRLVDSETRNSNNLRFGTVSHVDPSKQRMRMRLGGSDDAPFLSPWVPYGQTAGAMKFHNPPSVGQQFAVLTNGGDLRQSVAIPFTWSDENKSPSDSGDEHVLTFGSTKIRIKGDEVYVQRGESVIHLKADGNVEIVGPTVFKSPVTFEKGFRAKPGPGTGVAGTIEGELHTTGDVTSQTKVAAPVLQGVVQGV